jgi:hypothetical protein
VFFSAFLIAVIVASAALNSATAAVSSVQETSPLERSNPAPALTIATSLHYEINGSLYAWVNLTGHALITTNLAGYETINVTIRQLYLGFRVWLTCADINVNSTTGQGTANVTIGARVVGKVNIYLQVGSQTETILNSVDKSSTTTLNASLFVPWGTTNNFILPMPSFAPEQTDNSTADPSPVSIEITNENITSDSILSSTVRHVQFKFDDWLLKRVNDTINDLWGRTSNATTDNPQSEAMKVIPPPYPITTIGRIDLWKGNATTTEGKQVDNLLLMAGTVVNLVIGWDWVRTYDATGIYQGTAYNAHIILDLHANLGILYTLSVTTDYFRHKSWGDAEIATFDVQVPENATLRWRKIGVIVYYGSPALDCDVTGGESQGYWAEPDGQHKLFFVDHGWDGTPDFATNGTVEVPIGHPTPTVSGSSPKFTVQLDKTAGGWIYFSVRLPSGTSESNVTVTRSDGVTVNATQYWITNKYLYVCDDPTYTYTVEIAGAGGGISLTTILIVGGAALALVAILAVVLMRKKGGKPNSVSIK